LARYPSAAFASFKKPVRRPAPPVSDKHPADAVHLSAGATHSNGPINEDALLPDDFAGEEADPVGALRASK